MGGSWEEFNGKRDCEKSRCAQRRAGVSWDAGSVQGVDGLSGRGRESGGISGAVSERDARGSDCGAGRGAGQPDGASGMKVLIDECAPKALKVAMAASGFDCTTVQEAGWSGKENGELLALADASFDVVVTIDRNLRYQQNLRGRRIALLIVRARSNRVVDLEPSFSACRNLSWNPLRNLPREGSRGMWYCAE